MQYFRRLDLNCPVCGARKSIEYRYSPATKETESRCTVCRSNWIDSKRMGEKAIRQEYRHKVENDYYSKNRRDRPKKNPPINADPTDPEIREMLRRLDDIGATK